MRKAVIISVFVLFAVVGAVVTGNLTPSRNKLMSKFADSKESYAMLLSGSVQYEGDTIFFDLLPAIGDKIKDGRDVIVITKKSGETVVFTRKMQSSLQIPNPTGNGKAMKSWSTNASEMESKNAIALFEVILENGHITYSMFPTKDDLAKNFVWTYGLNKEDSEKSAAKASDPNYFGKI